MELKVQINNIFGVRRVYPACEKSKLFAKLICQKTLTENDMELIKKLGYTFTLEPAKL